MVKMTCVQCNHLLDILPLTFNIVVQVDATFYREDLQFQRGKFRIVSTELSNTDILPVKCPHCGFGAQLRNLVRVVYYCYGCDKKLKITASSKLYCHELDKRYCETCFKNKIETYCATCSYRSSCNRKKKSRKRRKTTEGDRRARNADIRRRFRMEEIIPIDDTRG